MGDKTDIEWCDATWNVTRGCSRKSAGCKHCYAENFAARFAGPGMPYEGVAEMRNGVAHWTGKIKFIPSKLKDPFLWKNPRSIFVDSMSDIFHDGVQVDWMDKTMAVMALADWHTFMILTRHDANMRAYFRDPDMPARVRTQILNAPTTSPIYQFRDAAALIRGAQAISAGPLPNLWLGVSVENQDTSDERIPTLLDTPAAKRFVSYEPALGPVDFRRIAPTDSGYLNALSSSIGPNLDAIIYGGESGNGAMAADPDWPRQTRDQCADTGTVFYFKQHGAWLPVTVANDNKSWSADDGGPVGRFGKFLTRPVAHFHGRCFVNVGKKAAGALLDGRLHQYRPWQPAPLPKKEKAA